MCATQTLVELAALASLGPSGQGRASAGRSAWARLWVTAQRPVARAVVLRTGEGFRVGNEPPVSLTHRVTCRRILEALVDTLGSGEALDAEQLFALGWPGEHASPKHAGARVYVALSELRKMGLRAFIVRHGAGYRLEGARIADSF